MTCSQKHPVNPASAVANGGSDDEVHIVVYDTDGGITGTKNSILEKYEALSMASDAKDSSGATNFYKKVIQRRSEWIWWTWARRVITWRLLERIIPIAFFYYDSFLATTGNC